MAVQVLNKDNFKTEVLESSLPVLVDFYALWCGPCKMIAPLIENLSEKYDQRVKFCKLDVDVAPEIAEGYGISSIPTLLLFKNGEKVAQRIGGASTLILEAFLNDNL